MWWRLLLCLLLAVAPAAAQKELNEKLSKGRREAARGNLPKAEKILREATTLEPGSARARLALADVLYAQRKLTAAAEEYERALSADAGTKELKKDDRLHAWSQRGVAVALNGNYELAEKVFKAAIAEDADYALFHYNLACTYAEAGDLNRAVASLRDAWKRRDNLREGESFPDPRKDSSFRRYLNNPKFQDAVNDMVF